MFYRNISCVNPCFLDTCLELPVALLKLTFILPAFYRNLPWFYIYLIGTGPILPKCKSNEFMCDDGECVDGRYKCDGQIDCFDESDEATCREYS